MAVAAAFLPSNGRIVNYKSIFGHIDGKKVHLSPNGDKSENDPKRDHPLFSGGRAYGPFLPSIRIFTIYKREISLGAIVEKRAFSLKNPF